MKDQYLVITVAVNGWTVEYEPGNNQLSTRAVFLDYGKMIQYIDSVLEPPTPEPEPEPKPHST